jgi:hypothetical protein
MAFGAVRLAGVPAAHAIAAELVLASRDWLQMRWAELVGDRFDAAFGYAAVRLDVVEL